MPDIPAHGLTITDGPTLTEGCDRAVTVAWSAGSGDLFHIELAPEFGNDYECYYLQITGAANSAWQSTSRYLMIGTATAGTFTLIIDGVQIVLAFNANQAAIQAAFDGAGIDAVITGAANDFIAAYDDAPASALYSVNLTGATMVEFETGVPSYPSSRGTTDLSFVAPAPILASDGSLIYRVRTLFNASPPGVSNVISIAPVSGLQINYYFGLGFANQLHAGDLVFLAILNEDTDRAPTTITFPGLSWTLVTTLEMANNRRFSVYRAVAPAGLTSEDGAIQFGNDAYDTVSFAAAALPGFNTLIATGEATGHSSTATVSMSPDPNSALLALAALDHIDTVNWAIVSSVADGGPEIIWEGPQSVPTDPIWTLTDARSWAVVAVELQRT